MIRPVKETEVQEVLAVINDAAAAYKGHIAPDCWKEPYMPEEELREEIAAGVRFYAFCEGPDMIAVMGIQYLGEVTLIRHAYTRTAKRGQGIGGKLLKYLEGIAESPVLIGTWKAAAWAVSFYLKHGYTIIDGVEKDRLLMKYWELPARQVETSIVMADQQYISLRGGDSAGTV